LRAKQRGNIVQDFDRPRSLPMLSLLRNVPESAWLGAPGGEYHQTGCSWDRSNVGNSGARTWAQNDLVGKEESRNALAAQ
jgi:hypothetical protein